MFGIFIFQVLFSKWIKRFLINVLRGSEVKISFCIERSFSHLMFYFSPLCTLLLYNCFHFITTFQNLGSLFSVKKTRKLDLQVSCARPHIDMLLLITSHPLVVRIFIQILKVNSPVVWFSSIWCTHSNGLGICV